MPHDLDPELEALRGQRLEPGDARRLALELFVAGYDGTSLPRDYSALLEEGLSGAILFRRNLVHDERGDVELPALCEHTQAIQTAAELRGLGLPAICAVDQEGGAVARLRAPFTVLPPMRELAERGDFGLLRAVGQQLGRECLAAGFNVDFAPILDVDTNPDNPIIGNRAFSRDAEVVAACAGAVLQGLSEAGVLGCGKHFPGHGDTDVDSHLALPVLHHDLERMRRVELVPFERLAGQLPMIMTAHVLFPALDPDRPATLSRPILQTLLRERCGYDGVIVSDDLDMQGIVEVASAADCVRLGLDAGVDLFLACRRRDNLEQAWAAAAEVLAGPAEDPRRAAALLAISRVRRMRAQLRRPQPTVRAIEDLFGSVETGNLRRALAAGTLERRTA